MRWTQNASLRDRIGLGEVQNELRYFSPGPPQSSTTKSAWVPALALGGGIDYALTDHWIVGGEALYLAAARQSVGVGEGTFEQINPSQTLLKANVAYKF